MLHNLFITAIRNLWKHPLFSLIHVGGLAVGLTAGILVLHYARLEYDLDTFHKDHDRIYRVATARIRDGAEVSRFATTFAGVGPALQADYPEIENYTRLFLRSRGGIVTWDAGNVRFREKGLFNVDSGFFRVFSFPVIAGNPEELNAPGTAFLEEQTAKRYFGDTNPIGQRITFGTIEGTEEYEVRGVVRCPQNSSIRFTFLLSYHNLGHFFGREHYSNWNWLDFHTFIKVRQHVDPHQIENRFPDLLKKFRGDRAANSKLILQPLQDLYLKSSMEFETGLTGDEGVVRILIILGIIVLAIVGFNFINLSTAQSFTRAREVGIRKTLGSPQLHLILQFLTETAMIHLLAILLSLLLLGLSLPWFGVLTGRTLLFVPFLQTDLWIYLAIFFVCGTLIIGLWPAYQLSSFRPATVLKGQFTPGTKGFAMRQVFVGFQALVSFSLVVAILIILDQVEFLRSRDIGFRIQNALVIPTPSVVNNRDTYLSSLSTFKSEMLKNGHVQQVATAADAPGSEVGWISGVRKVSSPVLESTSMYRADIDEGLVSALGLTVVAGQNFQPGMTPHDVLLNESALKVLSLGASESIGQRILCGSDTFTVVGVLRDFHQVSPREPVSATVYHYTLETPRWFIVPFTGEEDAIIRLAEQTYKQIFPGDFFDFQLLEERYDKQYQLERQLATIMMVFCGLAVAVSALGLLGLTTFTLSRRKKELAIRKVVGSSEWQLYGHASGSIFRTTLIGCLIGVPLTTGLMNNWLNGFSQHTSVQAWMFLVAGIVSMMVALSAVTGYTLKIIRTNPVLHLRSE